MKKILLVFGTRPEAIKMCPLVQAFKEKPDEFETIVCVTGQHREMLDQVLNLFQIKPAYDLNVMKQGQDLYDITARVLAGMRDVLKETAPDLVFVHGDTTTSMAVALAAFYQQVKVAHVEAGLRTHNIYSPWPEEMNRRITGRIATFHFPPTPLSKQNLLNEGVAEEQIYVVGNTVIDALHAVLKQIRENPAVEQNLLDVLAETGIGNRLACWRKKKRRMVLITGHRRENFGDGFVQICRAIKTLAGKYNEVDFVYPMHLNPNVRKPIAEAFGDDYGTDFPNIFFIEPLDYLPFVYMMNLSTLLLTDSGGIQEEGPGLGKPVLVMRNTTERPEAVEAGTVQLTGTDCNTIVEKVSTLLDSCEAYRRMAHAANPYGDGEASRRIVNILQSIEL